MDNMNNDDINQAEGGPNGSSDDTQEPGGDTNFSEENMDYGQTGYRNSGPNYNDNMNYNNGMNYNNMNGNNSYYHANMNGSGIGGFFSFDKMITPSIIKLVFYLGIIASVITGLVMIFSGINSYYGGGVQVFMGIFTIIIMPIIVRIYCELLIVIFKIHESLIEIKNK